MELLEPPPAPKVADDEPPGIIGQADEQGWKAGIFSFGKAEHPRTDYFNPGLVERPDGLWLLARRSAWEHRLLFGFNDVVAFKLGGPDGLTPQIGYKVKFTARAPKEQIEDPRVIYHNGKTWISCTDFVWFKNKKWTGAHQVLLQCDDKWMQIERYDIPYGKNGNSVGLNTGSEKNWLWFFHEDRLHMIYGANPHTVVEFDPVQRRVVAERRTDRRLNWAYGQIRGGTPPVLVNGEYFTFFHSSLPWTSRYRRYFTGAYAFEARPPFGITRITEEPLLVGSQNDYWVNTKPLVNFCCGLIMQGQDCLITFGINDLKSGWCRIPFRDLTQRMKRV